MRIYVGNLSYKTTDGDLEQAFQQFGDVTSARVIIDKTTNRSRGFGFVEMGDDEAGRSAVQGMDGKAFQGRTLKVNEARPQANTRDRNSSFRPRYE